MAANRKADEILAYLHRVALERHKRAGQAGLGERVQALKAYQHRRFAHTHADLLANPRYRDASQFFLDHLYGPADFSSRDDQFARVVPTMIRLFPGEVIDTVAALAELHAISEQLDTRMALHLAEATPDRGTYISAWQATGDSAARHRQIDLSVQIGQSLDRLTRNPLIRHSLRMMRGPARAAGLSELQRFLEGGFDAFRTMRGAEEFLTLIAGRERKLTETLDAASPPYELQQWRDLLP